MDKLAEYGKKLNNYVLKNEGDIFDLKKLADELNRDFYADVVELKATFCQQRCRGHGLTAMLLFLFDKQMQGNAKTLQRDDNSITKRY